MYHKSLFVCISVSFWIRTINKFQMFRGIIGDATCIVKAPGAELQPSPGIWEETRRGYFHLGTSHLGTTGISLNLSIVPCLKKLETFPALSSRVFANYFHIAYVSFAFCIIVRLKTNLHNCKLHLPSLKLTRNIHPRSLPLYVNITYVHYVWIYLIFEYYGKWSCVRASAYKGQSGVIGGWRFEKISENQWKYQF